jgi:hypothetical protein
VTPTKICTGRCGRELPADAEHFHRLTASRDGFKPRCRACTNADERDRRAGRRPAPAAPPAVPSLPPDPPRSPCGFASDPQARFRLIQRRAEMTPRDPAAAPRARRIMAKADEAVRLATTPPYLALDPAVLATALGA